MIWVHEAYRITKADVKLKTLKNKIS
jgi:hypothetical protein